MRLNKVLTYGVSASIAALLVAVALSIAIGTPAASTGDGGWEGDSYDHELRKVRGGGDEHKCVDESCNEETEKNKCVDESCNREKKVEDSYNREKRIDDSYNKDIDKDSHDQDNDRYDDDQKASSTQKSEDDRSIANHCTDKSVTKQPETADADGGDGGDGGKSIVGDGKFPIGGDGGDGEYGGDGGDPSFGDDDTGDMKCKIDVDHTGSSSCQATGAIIVQQCPGQVEGDNQQSTNIRDEGGDGYKQPWPAQETRETKSSGGGWSGLVGGLFGL